MNIGKPGRNVPSLDYFGTYPRLFRVHAHHLIAWGYQDGRQRIRSDGENEPDITSFFCEAIEDRLRDPYCPGWCTRYSVKENPPVRHPERTGNAKPKPDVIIEGSGITGRPEYAFEAKRLGGAGHSASDYTGKDGMGCFISGTYAARYDEAAMLGYVQSESTAFWRAELRSTIDRKARKLCLRSPQRDEGVVGAFPGEWVSEHDRAALRRPIELRHIMLDCRPL